MDFVQQNLMLVIAVDKLEFSRMVSMKKKIIITIVVIALLWLAVGLVDYFRVTKFEKPLFCVSRASVYNGAENYLHCQGIGYSFEIAGNFDTTDELSGVTKYTYFIFGNEICSGIRD